LPKTPETGQIGERPGSYLVNVGDNAFGKGQPQKWPGFTPPRSRKMPPLRGLLLLRRVHQRIDFVRKNEILAGSFFVRKPSQQGD
jgi:hypothetical protein